MAESTEDVSPHSFALNKSELLGRPELPLDMQFNEGHRMAIVMYLCLMFVSATGNIYVFCSIMRLRKRGKLGRINLLLLNLATADLVVTFVMMPLEITWNATVSWYAGDLACRFLSFFRVFGLYLSGFIVICICLDRYFAVIKPLAIGKAHSRNKKLLATAWIASVVCSLPQSFIFHVERHPEFDWYEQCITFNTFPTPKYELAYNLFGFCLMYALPMATILYCYSRILYKVYTINGGIRNETPLRRSSGVFIQRAKTKTLKMTVITMVAFSICWTPYNIISLWYWFDKSSAMELDQRLQKALFAFACTNSCVNPLIYGWYHVDANASRNLDLTSNQHQIGSVKMTHRHQHFQQKRCLSVKDGNQWQKIRIIKNPCSAPPSCVMSTDLIVCSICKMEKGNGLASTRGEDSEGQVGFYEGGSFSHFRKQSCCCSNGHRLKTGRVIV